MMIKFTKKHLVIFAASLTICLVAVVVVIVQNISPANQERQAMASELQIQQQQVEELSGQIRRLDMDPLTNTTALQQKLPVIPLSDQFILHLNRAEGLSNSQITNMSIDYDREIAQIARESGAVEAEEESESEEESDDISVDGMRQIKVDLSVNANNYRDLAQFITAIDELPRLSNVDSLSFRGRDEGSLINEDQGELQFNVSISTFFYPALIELESEAPNFQYRPPSGKENPLYER